MPRDVSMRKNFIQQFGKRKTRSETEKKEIGKMPPKLKKELKRKVTFKEFVGAQSIRMQIAYAAQDKRCVILRYRKATTGEVKRYLVQPYSYRFRRNKKGSRQKALYAYDVDDRSIKSYYVRNLKGVEATAKTFKPKWSLEIG